MHSAALSKTFPMVCLVYNFVSGRNRSKFYPLLIFALQVLAVCGGHAHSTSVQVARNGKHISHKANYVNIDTLLIIAN